jgi:DNA polymerase-3 subunit alpha
MVERLDEVVRAGQSLQRQLNTNQISLFGNSPEARRIPRRSANLSEWPINRKLAFEREALGFYISGHPLEKFRGALKRMGASASSELRQRQVSVSEVCMGGVVTALKLKNTRKGDRYATFGLEDWIGSVEAIVWPDVYRKIAHLLTAEEPVVVYGRLDVTDERCTLIVDRLESLIELRDRIATQGLLRISGNDELDQKLDRLYEVVDKHSGKCPLKLLLEIDGAEVSVLLRDKKDQPICVAPSEALCDEVEQLFGKPVLNFIN